MSSLLATLAKPLACPSPYPSESYSFSKSYTGTIPVAHLTDTKHAAQQTSRKERRWILPCPLGTQPTYKKPQMHIPFGCGRADCRFQSWVSEVSAKSKGMLQSRLLCGWVFRHPAGVGAGYVRWVCVRRWGLKGRCRDGGWGQRWARVEVRNGASTGVGPSS